MPRYVVMGFSISKALSAQGKALGPHPAFMDRATPVTTYQVGNPREEKKKLSQREASRHFEAYGGPQAIDHVYGAVNVYADAASSADYRLVDEEKDVRLVRTKKKGTPPEYEVGPKDLYDLLEKPNPYMLYHELIALLIIDYMLVGNAYWMKWRVNSEGKPLAIYRLAPQYVKIIAGPFGPEGYQYQPPGAREPLNLKAEDVVHFRMANPHSGHLGLGKIQGAGRMMDLEIAVTDTVSAYYENRADPSMIVQSEKRIPRDVHTKLFAQLRARATGPSQAGALLLLENGLKAETLDRTASEALFAEISTMSRDDIYALFRLSPLLFGHMDQTSGAVKVADMRRDWENSSLRPVLRFLSATITNNLTSAWGVKYEINHRSILSIEDASKLATTIATTPGVKVREARRGLQYLDPEIEESTGDPELDELVLNDQTPDADENGQVVDPATGKKTASKNVGSSQPAAGQPGRPPKPTNRKSIGSPKKKAEGKALEEAVAALEAKALMDGSTPAPDNRLPGEERPDPFARSRALDIDASMGVIERGLYDAAMELERDLLSAVEGKALKTSDLVGRVRGHEAWKKFRSNVAEAMREGITRAAVSGSVHSGLAPGEELDYDAIADEIINRKGGLNSIVKTLKERVVKRVREARTDDAERVEYQFAISDTIKHWAENQASMIADTEAVHAYNEATLTTAELAGVTEVYVTDGHDTDEPCQAAHGSVWDIETARENRLEHPRCRRAFLPLTPVSSDA